MGYDARIVNKMTKTQMYDAIARQPDVVWPSRYGELSRPRFPTRDVLREVLRGPFGYHPKEQDSDKAPEPPQLGAQTCSAVLVDHNDQIEHTIPKPDAKVHLKNQIAAPERDAATEGDAVDIAVLVAAGDLAFSGPRTQFDEVTKEKSLELSDHNSKGFPVPGRVDTVPIELDTTAVELTYSHISPFKEDSEAAESNKDDSGDVVDIVSGRREDNEDPRIAESGINNSDDVRVDYLVPLDDQNNHNTVEKGVVIDIADHHGEVGIRGETRSADALASDYEEDDLDQRKDTAGSDFTGNSDILPPFGPPSITQAPASSIISCTLSSASTPHLGSQSTMSRFRSGSASSRSSTSSISGISLRSSQEERDSVDDCPSPLPSPPPSPTDPEDSDSEGFSDLDFVPSGEKKSRDLALLRRFVAQDPKLAKRLENFAESKNHAIPVSQSAVLMWQFIVKFVDDMRKKKEWEGRQHTIPAGTIRDFLDRRPSWFTLVEPPVFMAKKLGPKSAAPHQAVVAFLQEKHTLAEINRFSLLYVEKRGKSYALKGSS
ncbi:hypothetical protein GALMADRAFT_144088 [Galerina marginata CBS 339.88]|uniref:Uncharacterized protein n=1 Tax=Galerina marginata (strain CBS 339.88) TaxID=685588 RepID=A0A067SJE9_GALM3|nr:hypothetical protein GALMADRAFT_144088 [Galerina marginata CBS 339.88]